MALSLILGGWAGAVAWRDWVTRRIPNLLILALLAPAVLWHALHGQGLLGASALESLAGLALGVALTLPGYLRGALGAGDVKLAACLGLVMGARTPELLLIAAVLLGAASAMALAYARRHGREAPRIAAGPAFAGAFALQLALPPWLPL